MISHRYKCIFIHQRKCAGMSIMNSFGITPDSPDWNYFNSGWYETRDKVPPGYFVFSIVRNPWDRFISGWKFCESTKHRPIKDVLRNLPTTGKDFRHITRLQHSLFYHRGEMMLNYLIRYENLQNGFNFVCDMINKPREVLSRTNVTSHDHYSRYFDDEAKDLFYRHFKDDIELFGYRFEAV